MKTYFLSTETLTGAASISFCLMAKLSSFSWSLAICPKQNRSRIDLKDDLSLDGFEGSFNYKHKKKKKVFSWTYICMSKAIL